MVLRGILAFLFVGAGLLHMTRPALFIAIVPPGLGDPRLDVLFSGLCEMLGGAGLLISRVRLAAAVGLCALLVAVWPANWFMALHAEQFHGLAPAWALWARLPLQILLLILVWRARV